MKFPSWAVITGRTDIEACNPPTAAEVQGMIWLYTGSLGSGMVLFLIAGLMVVNRIFPLVAVALLAVASVLMLFAAFASRSHNTYAYNSTEEDLFRLRCGGDLSKAILAYIHRVDTLGRRLTESEAKAILAIANKEIRMRERQQLYAAPSDQAKD